MTSVALQSGFNIVLRPMQETDRNFVLNSWLKSYRKAPENLGLRDPVYYEIQSDVVSDILKRADVLIAGTEREMLVEKDEAGQIVRADFDPIAGWICVEADTVPVLHYGYVKYPFRQLGVMRELFRQALGSPQFLDISHFTHSPWIEGLFRKMGESLSYDPRLKRD